MVLYTKHIKESLKNYMRRTQTFLFIGFTAAALCGAIITLITFGDVRAAQNDTASLFGKSYEAGKPVPRKDFASALIQLKGIKTGKNTSCFTDLKRTDPANSAICALKKINLFKGIKKFKPDKTVDMNFAITTLCRNYHWTLRDDYLTCANYAKKHKILASKDALHLRGSALLTYDRLADIMMRANDPGKSVAAKTTVPKIPIENPSTSTISSIIPPEETINAANFTPVEDSTIPATFFENIQLTNPLPTRFYRNEVYFIEGDITDGSTAREAFVFLCSVEDGCDRSINFIEKTVENHFNIPVFFRNAGNYKIGIIPGRSGESHVANISVLEAVPASDNDTAPINLSALYKNGAATFTWDSNRTQPNGNFTRLIIFQGSLRKDYIFRRDISSFSPPPEDFSSFHDGDGFWLIARGSTQSAIQKANLVMHNFRKVDDTAVTINQLPEIMSTPAHFTFSATARQEISKRVAMTMPDGTVKEFFAGTSDIPPKTNFNVQVNLPVTGTYIFEVNNPQGSAVINVPLYVGDIVPLLPDFFDLSTAELDPMPLKNLIAARNTMLSLINSDRATMNLGPVTLSNDINAIAQAHTEDMLAHNFFGHVNPSGESPDDRRKKAGITIPIRENLGKASSLELIEAGLMRSPIHREALIDPTMTHVGIGIVKNAEGYYLVTQNFAGTALTSQDITTLEQTIAEAGNNARLSSGLTSLEQDSTLKSITKTWSARMAQEGFFGTTDPQGVSIINTARQAGITSALQIYIVEASSSSQLTDSLLSQDSLLETARQKIGVGIGMNATGDLLMTVIYTP